VLFEHHQCRIGRRGARILRTALQPTTLVLVVFFSIEFFARHAVEGLAVFGGAAYLTPMATRGRRIAIGELDVGLLTKKPLRQVQVISWRNPAQRRIDNDIAVVVAHFVRVQCLTRPKRVFGPWVAVIAVDGGTPAVVGE
jgi:hypothetical protein